MLVRVRETHFNNQGMKAMYVGVLHLLTRKSLTRFATFTVKYVPTSRGLAPLELGPTWAWACLGLDPPGLVLYYWSLKKVTCGFICVVRIKTKAAALQILVVFQPMFIGQILQNFLGTR